MAKLITAKLESNPYNDHGFTVALYFDETPTENEVRKAFVSQRGKLGLSIDVDDPNYGYDDMPDEVSVAAGLVRILGYPAG